MTPDAATNRRNTRFAIIGCWNWLPVAAELFRRAGMKHDVVDLRSRRRMIGWFLGGGHRNYDAICHVGGSVWLIGVLASIVRKPVLWHWIGSDVLSVSTNTSAFRRRLVDKFIVRGGAGHLADSPQLAEELRELGVSASVVRLLTKCMEAAVEPLPARPCVLAYWNDERMKFYGGDIVMQLAREFPQVEFKIVAANGVGVADAPPNVKFLGYQKDLGPIYRQCTALIRLPEHDSLSAMVLEALARGRYVIYNKPMEGVYYAADIDHARAALRDILGLSQPNVKGAAMVKREFSLDREAAVLKAACASLLETGIPGAANAI